MNSIDLSTSRLLELKNQSELVIILTKSATGEILSQPQHR